MDRQLVFSMCLLLTLSATAGLRADEERAPVRNALLESQPDAETDGDIVQTQFGAGAAPIISSFLRTSTAAGPAVRGRSLLARAPRTTRRRRYSRAPDMLGDTFLPPLQLLVMEAVQGTNGLSVQTPLPLAGGSARNKISEQNKALPVDRFYANYNHFHNAVQRQSAVDIGGMVSGVDQQGHLDRFVLGMERTLLAGDASVEFRLPLSDFPDFQAQDLGGPPGADVATDSGSVGNLSVIGKFLVLEDDDWFVSAGLGVDLPTGSDASTLVGDGLYTVRNEAVSLQPFFAVSGHTESFFLHSFLQVDASLNGNPLIVNDVTGFGSLGNVGSIEAQTLLHFDTSAGYWLLQRDSGAGLTGLAALLEFHLTTSLENTSGIGGFRPAMAGVSQFDVRSSAGDFTASYVTSGVHAEFAEDLTVRAAVVAPLADGLGRFFDAEVLIQVGRRY